MAWMSSLERLENWMASLPSGTGLPSLNLPVMVVERVMQAGGMPSTRTAGSKTISISAQEAELFLLTAWARRGEGDGRAGELVVAVVPGLLGAVVLALDAGKVDGAALDLALAGGDSALNCTSDTSGDTDGLADAAKGGTDGGRDGCEERSWHELSAGDERSGGDDGLLCGNHFERLKKLLLVLLSGVD